MRFITSTITILSVVASAVGQSLSLNTSEAYYLRTQLKSNQTGQGKHEDLWLSAYHTGAGLNDAVLNSNRSRAIAGFTNATNITNPDGGFFQYQEFDLGSAFPWGLYIQGGDAYSAWQPVRVNAGYGSGYFALNSTGLQWYGYGSFGGWLVCDWWHGVPQLFAKLGGYVLVFRNLFEEAAELTMIDIPITTFPLAAQTST